MKLGFIGAGNMAGAIIQRIAGSDCIPNANIHVYDLDQDRTESLSMRYGITAHSDCTDMIKTCDMILVGVKPYQLKKVLDDYNEALSGKALISIAAGWTTKMLKDATDGVRLLRVMPNTPAMVGSGMTALSYSSDFTSAERKFAEQLFSAVGDYQWLSEDLIEAAIGVMGSGPAYAYMFIEAMADGGVLQGLTRADAQKMAAQTLLGAAKMVLESGKHPGALKDMVCSPGGTTIEAVRTLENNGFRGAVIEAVCAASERAKEMQA